MLEMMRKLMLPPTTPSSSKSFSEESESNISYELEEAVEEFMAWMERTCPPPKSGAEKEIPTDIYEELKVSYNEDLELRIETETTYEDQVVIFLNSSETTGLAMSSDGEIVG